MATGCPQGVISQISHQKHQGRRSPFRSLKQLALPEGDATEVVLGQFKPHFIQPEFPGGDFEERLDLRGHGPLAFHADAGAQFVEFPSSAKLRFSAKTQTYRSIFTFGKAL